MEVVGLAGRRDGESSSVDFAHWSIARVRVAHFDELLQVSIDLLSQEKMPFHVHKQQDCAAARCLFITSSHHFKHKYNQISCHFVQHSLLVSEKPFSNPITRQGRIHVLPHHPQNAAVCKIMPPPLAKAFAS